MQASCESHLVVVKRIFWYLKGTLNLGLHFVKSPISAITSFCDTNWTCSHDDRRSITSFAIFMGEIFYLGRQTIKLCYLDPPLKLNVEPLPQPQHSLCGICTCLRFMATWYCALLFTVIIRVFSILLKSKKPMFHHRTKHIEIDVQFVHEQVACGIIKLAHVSNQDQVVDIFTKSLFSSKFTPN